MANLFDLELGNAGMGDDPEAAERARRLAKQAGLLGMAFAPGAGVSDYMGYFPSVEGGYEPGAVENFRQGNYGTSALQLLGAGGDMLYAVPLLGATVGSALKAPRAAQKALKAERKLRNIDKAKLDEKKIAGAPIGVTNTQGEAARRKIYKDHMNEGLAGRNWYDDSGSSLLFHAGDDPALANKLGEAFSVTSSSTGVGPNTAFAIKGHNQAMAGAPIDTGRFPQSMGPQISEVYSNAAEATGMKRSPFADQLAIGGNYYQKPAGQGRRAVHDIWDGDAWGYANADGTPVRRGFGEAEHRWMDEQMDRVISESNASKLGGFDDWTPGRAQAATWTGAKIRAGDIAPDQAAFSYADAIPMNYAQQSREAVTGRTTGHNVGLLDAPLDVRRAYDDAVTGAVYDPKGRDNISKGYGLLTGESFYGPGIFEGNINPGRQSQVAVGRATGSPYVDPASKSLLDATESTYGLLTAQDAAAWNTLAPNKVSLKASDRVDIPLGGTISDDAMMRVNDFNAQLKKQYNLDYDPLALIPTPDGLRLLNFGLDNQDFVRASRGLAKDLGTDPKGARFGVGSNEYIEGNWNKISESPYLANIEATEAQRAAAGVPSGFDAVAPGLAGKLNDIDKQFGFELSPVIMTMRKAIADNGLAGLRELIKKGALPAVLVAAVAPYLSEEGGGNPAI